ncbi:hypothetical protein [Morganella morganii IS15]|nr:hypothetical protein [Morganella morganii IS15]
MFVNVLLCIYVKYTFTSSLKSGSNMNNSMLSGSYAAMKSHFILWDFI